MRKPVIKDETARALWGVFRSPNESDRNLEPANVVDGLFEVARAIDRLAKAVSTKTSS